MKYLLLTSMEKKTIFLELPSDTIDMIDRKNDCGDRSSFITGLLNKQLDMMITSVDISTDITSTMKQESEDTTLPGELKIFDKNGSPVGRFNIDTVDGFEDLASTICEISNDPIVRMRARKWR